MPRDKREFVQLNKIEMWQMKEVLKEAGIDLGDKCHYCGKRIKRGDKFSIFNKPDRLICDSVLCMSEYLDKDEENAKKEKVRKSKKKIEYEAYKRVRKFLMEKTTCPYKWIVMIEDEFIKR